MWWKKLQLGFSHCSDESLSYVAPLTNISFQLNPGDFTCLNKIWGKFEGCMNSSAQWNPTPIILEDIGIGVFHIVMVFYFLIWPPTSISCNLLPIKLRLFYYASTPCNNSSNALKLDIPLFLLNTGCISKEEEWCEISKGMCWNGQLKFLVQDIGRALLDVSRVHISCFLIFSAFQNQ